MTSRESSEDLSHRAGNPITGRLTLQTLHYFSHDTAKIFRACATELCDNASDSGRNRCIIELCRKICFKNHKFLFLFFNKIRTAAFFKFRDCVPALLCIRSQNTEDIFFGNLARLPRSAFFNLTVMDRGREHTERHEPPLVLRAERTRDIFSYRLSKIHRNSLFYLIEKRPHGQSRESTKATHRAAHNSKNRPNPIARLPPSRVSRGAPAPSALC